MLTAAVLAGVAVLLWPGRSSRSPVGGVLRAREPTGSSAADRAGAAAPRLDLLTGRLRGWPRRGRVVAGHWVADFAEVVAVGLDAGLDLASAARASARSPTVFATAPWLAGHLEASESDGAAVSRALEGAADASGAPVPDVATLVAAWRLSEEVGAGAADVTRAAAATVRSRRAARERTAAVVAGPRASMVLLTALPVAGPASAMLLGVGPASLYGSVAAAFSAAFGGLLTATGWWWGRTLLRRAARAARTDAEPT